MSNDNANPKVQETIASISTEFDVLNEDLKKLKEEIKCKVQSSLKPSVKKIFDAFEGRLTNFAILGYTPGFNDGDPCTHGQYMEEDDEEGNDIPYSEHSLIDSYFDKFSESFQSIYGTDWRLVFSLDESGEVHVEREDYDCGY